MRFALLLCFFLLASQSAEAARFSFPSGVYKSGRLEFNNYGDLLQVYDRKREITYELRLDQPGVEQPLPREFLDPTRFRAEPARSRKLIKALSIVNPVVVDSAGKMIKAEGRGTFRVGSVFGFLEADFKTDLEIQSTLCYPRYWNRGFPCVQLAVHEIALTAIRSDAIPQALLSPLGLILDVVLQLGAASGEFALREQMDN